MKKPIDDKAEPPVTWGRMTMCEVMPPCPHPRAPQKPAEKAEGSVPADPAAQESQTDETLEAVGAGPPSVPPRS